MRKLSSNPIHQLVDKSMVELGIPYRAGFALLVKIVKELGRTRLLEAVEATKRNAWRIPDKAHYFFGMLLHGIHDEKKLAKYQAIKAQFLKKTQMNPESRDEALVEASHDERALR